jgi:hypothetical protein
MAKVLGVQLAGDGEVGGLAEKVLGIVDFAVLGSGTFPDPAW